MNRFSYGVADGIGDIAQMASAGRALARSGHTGDDNANLGLEPLVALDRAPLTLAKIEDLHGGGLRLGAFVTNADIAYDPRTARCYPLLVAAILAGASPQLRNAATSGGNLDQRTRCYYFYEPEADSVGNEPRAESPNGGVRCVHEILGASGVSSGTHLSDMAVALTALDAKVRIVGPDGERVVPFTEYCRLAEDNPWLDNCLHPGELMIAVDLPPEDFSRHFAYSRLHDNRAVSGGDRTVSEEIPSGGIPRGGKSSNGAGRVSVAVGLRLEGGRISEARLALGGFAHSPWRSPIAESGLAGERVSLDAFAAAAHDVLSGAVGQGDTEAKIEVARGAIIRALERAVAMA
jgi:xanthine dehydrogenase YagS FAD-binding subunit